MILPNRNEMSAVVENSFFAGALLLEILRLLKLPNNALGWLEPKWTDASEP